MNANVFDEIGEEELNEFAEQFSNFREYLANIVSSMVHDVIYNDIDDHDIASISEFSIPQILEFISNFISQNEELLLNYSSKENE